jgi:hypothetical protein
VGPIAGSQDKSKSVGVVRVVRPIGKGDCAGGGSEAPQSPSGAEPGAQSYLRDAPLPASVLGLSASWANLQRSPNEHPPGLSC